MLNKFFLSSILTLTLWATPNAPSNLNLIAHTHSVDITWSDNSQDESGFKIYRDAKLVTIVPQNTTHYKDRGLEASYYLSIYYKSD